RDGPRQYAEAECREPAAVQPAQRVPPAGLAEEGGHRPDDEDGLESLAQQYDQRARECDARGERVLRAGVARLLEQRERSLAGNPNLIDRLAASDRGA